MPKNYEMLSELEREFELDMAESGELEIDASGESGEFETDDEFEGAEDSELEEDSESDDSRAGSGSGEFEGDYAERLYELSQREFESPDEASEAVDGVLNEMYENFLGLSKVRNYIKKKGAKLLKTGMRIASHHPAFGLLKNVLAGKNLTQVLSSLGQTALSASPMGAALLPALKSLGFPGGNPEEQKEAWSNFVDVAREAYTDLAENLNEAADQPFESAQLATRSLKRGVEKVLQRRRNGYRGRGAVSASGGKILRIRVRPGQRIRLVIVGG
ncbi:MAG TPA: hypothetical protein VMZ52_03590 [Bryobacteraceae bacterium]|nr:hypothetical protein [Bryobacteraceae bacterium]